MNKATEHLIRVSISASEFDWSETACEVRPNDLSCTMQPPSDDKRPGLPKTLRARRLVRSDRNHSIPRSHGVAANWRLGR